MKKILVTIICGIVAVAAMAQENDSKDRWYVQGLMGLTNTGTETLGIGEFGDNIGFTGGAALGYQFNPNVAVSAQLQYARNHSKNAADGKAYGFDVIEPSINLELNLSNIILGYKEGRKNFFNLYAGVATALTTDLPYAGTQYGYTDNNYALGFRAGLQYERAMKNNWAFLVDAGINSFNDKFDHHVGGGLDSHVGLQIGLRKYFGEGKNRKHRGDFVDNYYNIVEKHDTTIVKKIEEVQAPKEMYSIFFEIDKIEIRPSEVGKIQAVADFLKAHPEKVVFVFGYADDNTGTKKRNQWLSTNRARVITEQLINTYGIDESRIISYGQGDKVQPFAEEVFEKNRATVCVIADFER